MLSNDFTKVVDKIVSKKPYPIFVDGKPNCKLIFFVLLLNLKVMKILERKIQFVDDKGQGHKRRLIINLHNVVKKRKPAFYYNKI